MAVAMAGRTVSAMAGRLAHGDRPRGRADAGGWGVRGGGEEPDMSLAGPRVPVDALDALPPCVGTCPRRAGQQNGPQKPAGHASPAVTPPLARQAPSTTSCMVHLALARVRAREQALLAACPARPWRPLGGPWLHRRACLRSSMPASPSEALRRASGGLQAGAVPFHQTERHAPASSAPCTGAQ